MTHIGKCEKITLRIEIWSSVPWGGSIFEIATPSQCLHFPFSDRPRVLSLAERYVNWADESLSYASYQENNSGLWFLKNNFILFLDHLLFQSLLSTLLNAQNNLLQAVNNREGVILVLLDLSAILETIFHQKLLNVLTHWGRVTHICVNELTIIGSDNGLSPGRHQAIIWNNAGLLLIEPLGTNFS